jgi:hypothetical protein
MMKMIYILRFCLILIGATFFTACDEMEEGIAPQQTCDTIAVVQYIPSCGLQLVLENGDKLVPVNSKITLTDKNKLNFEIADFAVKEGQQIIIGYKTVALSQEPGPCNVSHYYKNKGVIITCIVGLEPAS